MEIVYEIRNLRLVRRGGQCSLQLILGRYNRLQMQTLHVQGLLF